jgi:hypothetical protein
MKYKFQPNEKVFVKPFHKEGIVTGIQTTFNRGQLARVEYEVAIPIPSWVDYPICGVTEFLGNRSQNVLVFEQDLEKLKPVSPLEESLIAAQSEFTKNWNPGFEIKLKECECGMEKHGFANHSYWCAKF